MLLLFWTAFQGRDITSTEILQKPVDCVLAGDQESPVRAGSASGRALKRVFGE